MRPFNLSIVGTMQSPPSDSCYPSSADRQLFKKMVEYTLLLFVLTQIKSGWNMIGWEKKFKCQLFKIENLLIPCCCSIAW